MRIVKHTPIALFVGCQACAIQIIDNLIQGMLPPAGNVGFSWISFLAWATYFMAGCTVFNGVRAFAGFVIGIVASIVIITMGGAFGSLGFFAFPAAILIVAWLLFYLELAPEIISFIPSVYIASGAFFGCMNYIPGATFGSIFLTEMVYLTLGLVFGWMTIAFKTWLDGKRQAKDL